jgi:hypothetical protein
MSAVRKKLSIGAVSQHLPFLFIAYTRLLARHRGDATLPHSEIEAATSRQDADGHESVETMWYWAAGSITFALIDFRLGDH